MATPPRGAVLIAEPLAIRARRFRRVFVTGLCADEFPSPQAAITDPFLGDDRRRELALSSGLALPQPSDPLDRERYLLYACVSRATERVVFSYRSSDEDGNVVIASPFLDDIAALFPDEWRVRRRRRLLADVVWTEFEAPTERERVAGGGLRASSGPIRCCGTQSGPATLRPVRAGADPRAPPADRLRRCARGVRGMPGPVAGGAPTPTRSARAGSRPAHPWLVHSHGARARLSRGSTSALTPQTLPRAERLLHEEMRGPDAASERSTAGPRSGDRGACCDPSWDRGGAAALPAHRGRRRLRLAADRDRAAVWPGSRVRGGDATRGARRRPRAGAAERHHRPCRCRPGRPVARDRARLQERCQARHLAIGPLGGRSPDPGGALHDRGPAPAEGAGGRRGSTSHSPARICGRAARIEDGARSARIRSSGTG